MELDYHDLEDRTWDCGRNNTDCQPFKMEFYEATIRALDFHRYKVIFDYLTKILY